MNKTYRFNLSLVLLAATLAGCSAHEDDITDFINNPGNFVGKADPLPVVTPYSPIKYNPLGDQIDPFFGHTPKATNSMSSINAPDVNRPKDILENFQLESIRVAGMVSKGKKTSAIVITPDGVPYTVSYGDRIGPDYGVITGIAMNGDLVEIKIKETVPSSESGTWEERQNSILQTDAKNDPAKG